MANGYIGKISAVVTANTSDLSRKLQGAVKDVDRFANSLNRSVSASAQQAAASLEKIFTPLQRLERKLQTALQLNLRTDDEVRKIQQLVSVAEGINRPLERAAGSFSKLSLEVQGSFLPALNRAQDAAVNLSNTLQQQGSVSANSFKQVEQAVDRTAQAIQRLTQAQQLASQSLTGNELQFGNPRLFETLSANARITQQAGALPASALVDGDIARQIRALDQYQKAAVEAEARVASLRLEPNVNPEVVLAAERRLISLTETARRAGREVETSVANAANRFTVSAPREGPRGLGLFRRTAGTEEERAIQKARQLDAEFRRLPDAAQSGLQGLAGIVGRIADGVQAGTSNAQQLNTVLARLSAGITRAKEASRAFTLVETPQQPRGLGLFGTQSGTAEERAIQRARELDAAYRKLPQAAQDGLAGLGRIAGDIANRVEIGKASAEQLEEVLARLKAGIEQASEAPPPPPPTDLGNRPQQAGADRIRRLTGNLNIDSTPVPGVFNEQAQRDIDALASRVGQVRQQLETLPNSIRTQFIPALQQAQQQLIRLQNSPTATVNEINQAAAAVQRLEQNARRAATAFDFRSQFGGAGIEGIEQGLNEQALRGYTAQLQLLQQTLAGTSQAARGPAVQAFDRLRTAIANAMENGTIATEGTRRTIRQLTTEAANAAAAAANISPGALNRRLQRAGDIGRGAFGNIGLAVQQAIFAFDDFFSVTGGLDQRIRAAGNNISQLGFVIGGTAGLIGGVLVSAIAQGLVALIKWRNAGVETQDQQKALNDALQKQKTIVDELARAYENVADAIESAFSGATSNERRQQDLVREVRRQQQEQLQERLASADPVVQRERAIQNARQRTLEQTIEPSERRRLQREIDDSRRREREAAREAAQGPQLTAAQAAIAASQAAVGVAGATFLTGLTPEQQRAEARRGFPTSTAAAAAQADARERRAGVQAEIDAARTDRERRAAALRGIAEEERRIRDSITTGAAAFAPGETDRNEARRRALDELENLRVQLERGANAALNQAVEKTLQSALGVSSQIESALERLAESIGEGASITGFELNRANQALADAVERLRAARESGDEAGVQEAGRQVEATRELVAQSTSAANSLSAFAATIDRISTQLANTVAQEARSAADQARRDANAAQARADRLGNPLADADSGFARRQRQRLERDARRAEDRAAEVEAENSRVRDDFERDARRGGLGADTQRLIRERDAIDAVLRGDIAASDEQRQEARRRRDEIDRQLDRQFEDSPAGREAAARADRADREQAARAQREDDIRRGRELSRSPAEQAGRQLADDLRALQAARDEAIAAGGNRAALNRDFAGDRQRIIEESFRSTAPAIFALADSVANAVLQGPSRAALQATDVSTVEGARELNRLLRGDDAGRDQNLVELQKQSQSLDELVRIAREGGADIAN